MSNINTGSNSHNWRAIIPADEKTACQQSIIIEDEEFPCILPASPNWYSNNISSSLNGFYAFGGKNLVFIFDLSTKPPVCKWNYGSVGTSAKIETVALMCVDDERSDADYVALGTEDGLLKIVNIETKQVYKDIRKHKEKIIAVCWSPIRRKTLVSANEKGIVLIWNFEEKICNIWTPLNVTLTSVSLSNNIPSYLLLGYTNGNIIVGDVGKMEVLHTFKGHMHEIYSLSWKPYSNNENDNFFVSGSKDRTLRIWNLSEGKEAACYQLPKKISSNSKQQVMKTKTFNPVLWLNDFQILSGFHSGEVLVWDTSNGKWMAITNGHNRMIFSLCRDNYTNCVISVSMDRQVIFYNPSTLLVEYKVATFGGFVYATTLTPHSPHKLGVGVGDNSIRVCSTGIKSKPYENANIWQGIKAKVTVILYHPTKEGILGFGTDDGHVGCFSLLTQKSDVSVTYHQKTVYSLSWGPQCGDVDEKSKRANCLFSVGGEGSVYMHKIGAFNQDAMDVSKFLKNGNNLSPLRSDIAWHTGLEFVAVGNGDGTIDIFKGTQLTIVCKIQVHKKIVNTMAWHPEFKAESEESNCAFWLASGSNEEDVCVVDLKCVQQDSHEMYRVDQPRALLSGHSGRIIDVAWCPYKSGVLASASYDGTVQVWDVRKNIGLSNYRGHIGRVYCLSWSYNHPEVLFSGGEDFSLHRWRYTEQTETLPPLVKKSKSKSKKKKKDNTTLSSPTQTTDDVTIQNIVSNETATPTTSHDEEKQPSLQQQQTKEQKEPQQHQQPTSSSPDHKTVDDVKFVEKGHSTRKKRRSGAALFKKSSMADQKKKEFMQQDCIKLAEYLHDVKENTDEDNKHLVQTIEPGSEQHINLGLYGTRKDMYRMISTECEGHKENEQYDNIIQLEVWRNSIGNALSFASENGVMNEMMVAMSPMGGFDMWRAAMLSYAEHLEKSSHWTMSATCFVAIGDVRRAVDVLKRNHLYKEAIALAKSQLISSDPLLNELYFLWAKKLADGCSYEHSAECYLACGHVNEAIAMLCKRNDSNSIMTALRVAEVFDLKRDVFELTDRAIKLLLREHRWKLCHELLLKIPKIQFVHLHAVVGEILLHNLYAYKSTASFCNVSENHITYRYFPEQEFCYPTYMRETGNEKKTPFLYCVLSVFESMYKIIPENKSVVEELLHQCEKRNPEKLYPTSSFEKILYEVISLLVDGCLHILYGDVNACFKKWLTVLNMLSNFGYQSILETFCDIFLPSRKQSFDGMYLRHHNYSGCGESLPSLFTHFTAFSFHGQLYLKWWSCCIEADLEVNNNSLEENNKLNVEAASEKKGLVCEKYRHIKDSNLDSYIIYFSSVLLSGSHATYFKLQEQIRTNNEKLMELDIRKRLREHIQNKSNSTPTKECSGNKIGTIIEDDTNVIVNNIDEVVENEEEEKKRVLLLEKTSLSSQWNDLPEELKTYPFPNPKDSFPVLLSMCCLSRPPSKQIKILHRDLNEWVKKFRLCEISASIEATSKKVFGEIYSQP